MDCAQPLRAVCLDCRHQAFWRCDCANIEKCPDCAGRRREMIARLVDMGATDWLGKGVRAYFVTVTAPGENDHRRTYQGKRPKNRPDCTCHHVWRTGAQMGDWNREESAHWNRLRLALKRALGGDMEYIGAVEVQERGALHRHLMIVTTRPLTHGMIQPLATAAGYGCVADVEEVQTARKAAKYLSKYVVKSTTERGNVPWRADVVDMETGEIQVMDTVPTFRTWSSSQGWGFTLKGLRQIARVQAQARAMYLRELAELLEAEGVGTSRAAAGPAPADSSDPAPP